MKPHIPIDLSIDRTDRAIRARKAERGRYKLIRNGTAHPS